MRHSLILSCPPDTKNGEIEISKCLKRLMKSISFVVVKGQLPS